MDIPKNEYIAAIMSAELLLFCKEQDLPFDFADELLSRDNLTEYEHGFLTAYLRLWKSLID